MASMSETGNTPLRVDTQHPFLGLFSYKEEHQKFFFGRSKEIAEVVKIVDKHPVSVLFGKMGVGKSSLLQAGIIPRLREHYYLPVYVRLNFSVSKSTPVQQLRQITINKVQEVDKEVVIPENLSLWELFHELRILEGFVTPVIIFDQFEELFTIGYQNPESTWEFVSEMTDLVENHVPAPVQAKFQNNTNEIPDSYKEQNYRVVFSLKEDYLPHFESLNLKIPNFGTSRYRLLKMNGDSAAEAVMSAGKAILDQSTAIEIIKKMPVTTDTDMVIIPESGKMWENKSIDSLLLSLYCYRLNEKRIERNDDKIPLSLLHEINIGDIIKLHYYDNIKKFAPNIAYAIEKEMITGEGYRKIAPLNDFRHAYGISSAEIEQLVDLKLIVKHVREGLVYIELIHDVLAPVVQEARNQRLEKEKAQAEKERQEKEQRRKELAQQQRVLKEKKRSATLGRWIIGISAISFTLVVFIGFFITQNREIKRQKDKAYSNYLAVRALDAAQTDPTLSFRLAEEAYKASPSNKLAQGVLLSEFYNNDGFYSILGEHTNEINTIQFSHDGKFFITASRDNSASLWESNGNRIFRLRGHKDNVKYATFSHDSKYMITAGSDRQVIIWDKDGTIVSYLKGHTGRVTSANFSYDGKRVVTSSWDKTIKIWDLYGKCLQTIETNSLVNYTEFSPDNNYILAALSSGYYALYKPNGSISLKVKAHDDWVLSARFSRDGRKILTASYDKTAALWSRSGQLITRFIGHDAALHYADFSPFEQKIITASEDASIRIWDFNGNQLEILQGHQDGVNMAIFHPRKEGEIVSVGSDYTIRYWDIEAEKAVLYDITDRSEITAVRFSVDTKYVAIGNKLGHVKLFSLNRSRIQQFFFHLDAITDIVFSPNKAHMLTASADKQMMLWNLNGAQIQKFTGHKSEITSVDFSPSGRLIVSADKGGELILWRLDGTIARRYSPHNGVAINQVIFSEDGRFLYSAGTDGKLLKLSMETGKTEEITDHQRSIISFDIAPNGESFAMVPKSVNEVELLTPDETLPSYFEGHNNYPQVCRFMPAGDMLLSAGNDGTLRLWEVASGTEIIKFEVGAAVNVADCSPDGSYIITGDDKGRSLLWIVKPDIVLKYVNAQKIYGDFWQLDEKTRRRYIMD